MPIRRRTLAVSSTALLAAPRAFGQAIASPLVLIVPFAPGGSTDIFARTIQPTLQRELERTVVVENRPGASGTIALQAVARAQPDGSTIALITSSALIVPHVTQAPDAVAELQPVALLASVPLVIATHESRPWQHLVDVWQAARERPNVLTYGTGGNASVGHLCMERLQQQARAELVHVPYRGETSLIGEIRDGKLDLGVASSRAVSPHVGPLRLLAQTGAVRAPSLPSLQTVSEQSNTPFDMGEFIGAMMPRGAEPRVVERLSGALIRSVESPEVRSRVFELTGAHATGSRPEQFAALLDQRSTVFGQVARTRSIRTD